MGDPNGCVVCHGGNPGEEKNAEIAHTGVPQGSPLKAFNRHSGSMWINEKTCGLCHEKWVYAMHRSVMNTEAGKIQGALWGWGPAGTGYAKIYGNYDIDDPDGPSPVFGTEAYKVYTREMMNEFPNNFPAKLHKLPATDLKSIKEHPEQAVYTYIRTECQRCHVGVRGRDKRGDMRGMGCAACHIPYSNEGLYEGADPSIPKEKKGHLLVHSIQASRKSKVAVNGKVYSGIPHETCASCHNRGKRIGVSFQGLMEFPYGTPFTETGDKMQKLHTKYYLYIQDDAHHGHKSRDGNPEGSLLCQDCHTTTAFHGNGNITGTTLANVQIECTDCHGTATKYPWELPLGWGDEFGHKLDLNKPRGITMEPLATHIEFNTYYPPRDGYLLTARGTPFGNVVRDRERVVVHSASGLDFEVPTLNSIRLQNKWQNPKEATAAMIMVGNHLEKLECYACHSAWAPQCYGCHVKVDFSGGKTSTDWIASGNIRFADGNTAESKRDGGDVKAPGEATEARGYLRWENPILGVNGEGRVSPIFPGCQQITTVIGPDGKTLVQNKIWRTPPNTENGGSAGQRGIDMAPANPHTTARQARTCASCHTMSKTLGYGTHDGRYLKAYEKGLQVDIATAQGEILSSKARLQIPAIPDLPMDLDQVVTRENEQLQTVGHHWPLSGPLPKEVRDKMEKVGTCITCHQHIPIGSFNLPHKRSFHSQVMEQPWKPDSTFHNIFEYEKKLP
ncbi:MAG: cytochrome C [Pseudomonadota bacterium]